MRNSIWFLFVCFFFDRKIKRIMSLNDDDLKWRLARHGIVAPITETTRQVLFMKLHKLEGLNSPNNQTGLSVKCKSNDIDSLVS